MTRRDKNLFSIWSVTKRVTLTTYHKIITAMRKKPLTSFFTLLVMLFGLIFIGNLLRQPAPEQTTVLPVKTVPVYRIGNAPRITLQGQVQKAGVIQVSSLMGGVVQNISVSEGETVYQGQNLFSLSSNYQGGNSLTIARQIAESQYQNIQDTYSTQKDLIGKQKDLAGKNRDNTEELRQISDQSKSDTQSLIDLNNNLLDSVNSQLSLLPASSTDPVIESQIFSLKQAKTQLMSANLGLNLNLRNLDYQTNTDNPPAKIADLQKDITIKQLDLQNKALDLGREISLLQLRLSQVNEATMYPVAPFAGTVQNINVRVGQLITPGTPVLTLVALNDPPLTIYIYTSKEIAENVSRIEETSFHAGDKTLNLIPRFVTTEAVQNNLYAIIYDIPQEFFNDLTDKGFLLADVPIGHADTNSAFPYLPLDAIFQTQDTTTVFINDRGKVKSQLVELGPVYGNFVAVNSGLKNGDEVILDRNVIDGEPVIDKTSQ